MTRHFDDAKTFVSGHPHPTSNRSEVFPPWEPVTSSTRSPFKGR